MTLQSPLYQRMVFHAFPMACLALLLTGCKPAAEAERSAAVSQAGHDHEHPAEGPHHGQLVELGNEEYHAELVHEPSGAVTVYILDGSAKHAVPIDASELVINLSHDGNAEQFKLLAAPEANDPAGKASRFVHAEVHLGEDLDAEGSVAKLVVSIAGKQYTGKIEHQHDHGDHKH